MRKSIATLVLALAALGLVATPASATLLAYDNFDRPDGNLVGTTPTPGPGGDWENHSGTGSFIQIDSGTAVLEQGSGSREDANTNLGTTLGAGQTWYAAFDLTVQDPGSAMTDDVYFAHFRTGFTFSSRVFINVNTAGDGRDYGLALSDDSDLADAGDAFWPNGFNYGQTIRIVHSYDFDTGDAQMWVVPPSDGTSGGTSITATGGAGDAHETYALRQANPGNPDPTMNIDELCVATNFDDAFNCTPEPSTMTLFAFGAMALLRRKR